VNFAEKLKEAVEGSGKKQNRIAGDLSISPGALSNYLAGSRKPNPFEMLKIVRYFSKPKGWFGEGDNVDALREGEGHASIAGISAAAKSYHILGRGTDASIRAANVETMLEDLTEIKSRIKDLESKIKSLRK
jgi:transcriptional regulator with XRE-family HTH domain